MCSAWDLRGFVTPARLRPRYGLCPTSPAAKSCRLHHHTPCERTYAVSPLCVLSRTKTDKAIRIQSAAGPLETNLVCLLFCNRPHGIGFRHKVTSSAQQRSGANAAFSTAMFCRHFRPRILVRRTGCSCGQLSYNGSSKAFPLVCRFALCPCAFV